MDDLREHFNSAYQYAFEFFGFFFNHSAMPLSLQFIFPAQP